MVTHTIDTDNEPRDPEAVILGAVASLFHGNNTDSHLVVVNEQVSPLDPADGARLHHQQLDSYWLDSFKTEDLVLK
jgi:hypothetical protein